MWRFGSKYTGAIVSKNQGQNCKVFGEEEDEANHTNATQSFDDQKFNDEKHKKNQSFSTYNNPKTFKSERSFEPKKATSFAKTNDDDGMWRFGNKYTGAIVSQNQGQNRKVFDDDENDTDPTYSAQGNGKQRFYDERPKQKQAFNSYSGPQNFKSERSFEPRKPSDFTKTKTLKSENDDDGMWRFGSKYTGAIVSQNQGQNRKVFNDEENETRPRHEAQSHDKQKFYDERPMPKQSFNSYRGPQNFRSERSFESTKPRHFTKPEELKSENDDDGMWRFGSKYTGAIVSQNQGKTRKVFGDEKNKANDTDATQSFDKESGSDNESSSGALDSDNEFASENSESEEDFQESDMDDESIEDKSNDEADYSSMTMEELLKLQEKMGVKKFREKVLKVDHSKDNGTRKPIGRLNKNRPSEVPLMRRRAPRMNYLEPNKKVKDKVYRDPRFDDLSGTLRMDQWNLNYDFLKENRKKELQILKKEVKDETNPKTKEKMKRIIQRMNNQEQEGIKRERERKIKLMEKKQQIEALRQGKKPRYMSKKEKSLMLKTMQFEELKKKNKVGKFFERKEKKLLKKEKKQNFTF